ncbi:30S ribosomal protein S1 [Candidatus Velamenicoccus archaeovorus]|uniref:Small ribosomal subunit protein bS1 n=1 Tax=Velamenicoccus archaeovorus TaxID=1930593 RepID=A0A410P524_VELA1|nr:30S ribosomal protein S1 [Candidatus Velamenicoccus archaeovorus]QAT17222.1 30S ribosomal protein S1 [Candidatus Velamenicoccus archaeovorus]
MSEEKNAALTQLYEQSFKEIKEGEIVKGKIVRIGVKDVLIDVGYKSEGAVAREEFTGLPDLAVGQEVEVYVDSIEDDNGMIVLSRDKARRLHGWDKINQGFKEGDLVDGFVRKKVKGGFIVDVYGLEGFLPASLAMFRNVSEKDIVGHSFKFKIIKINSLRKSLIVSRKEAVAKEKEDNRLRFWETHKSGDVVNGLVKNITDFGAFIDLGGVDGLLHITDMSWSRISHPSEMLAVGDRIEVVILNMNKETSKVSLGLKQRMADPWTDVDKKFPVGTRLKGKVVNIVPYGVFVELEKGIEGLIHVSEISWQKRNINTQEMFAVGDTVEVQVLTIDKDSRRISLSIKQLEGNPWLEAENKFSVGSKVSGKISGFTDFGAFVELDGNLDGMIHVSDMSWTRRVMNPQEILKKGQKVDVVILSVDAQNKKISLGLKQAMESPWPKIAETYPIGTEREGEVTSKNNFGVFVRFDADFEGLLYINEIPKDQFEKVNIGDKIKIKIIKVDTDQMRIGLGLAS